MSILYLQANATQKAFESLGIDLPGPLGKEVSFSMRDYQDEVERRLGALEMAPARSAPPARGRKKTKAKAAPKRRKAKKKKR